MIVLMINIWLKGSEDWAKYGWNKSLNIRKVRGWKRVRTPDPNVIYYPAAAPPPTHSDILNIRSS